MMDLTFWRSMVNAVYKVHARVGTFGIIGFGCWIIALTTALLPIRELLVKRQLLMHNLVTLREEVTKVVPQLQTVNIPSIESKLPGVGDLTGILSNISRMAHEQGLAVSAADYKLVRETDAAIAQYAISFDVTGQYIPVRSFLQTVLNEEPALALRQISFARTKPTATALQSKISMTVFIRPKS